VLEISIATVICNHPLKKLAPPTVSPIPFNEASDKTGIELVCEIDKQCMSGWQRFQCRVYILIPEVLEKINEPASTAIEISYLSAM
jgi:hypothetical protein